MILYKESFSALYSGIQGTKEQYTRAQKMKYMLPRLPENVYEIKAVDWPDNTSGKKNKDKIS